MNHLPGEACLACPPPLTSTTNPSSKTHKSIFQKQRFLKHYISIYAYTYIVLLQLSNWKKTCSELACTACPEPAERSLSKCRRLPHQPRGLRLHPQVVLFWLFFVSFVHFGLFRSKKPRNLVLSLSKESASNSSLCLLACIFLCGPSLMAQRTQAAGFADACIEKAADKTASAGKKLCALCALRGFVLWSLPTYQVGPVILSNSSSCLCALVAS